jgi:sugar phosphate isomerase/epimerase
MKTPERFAMHQGTTERQWSFEQAVEGYARHGIRAMTVRRESIEEMGAGPAGKRLRDAGIEVLGVSRCAPVTEDDPGRRAANHEQNRRAIALAADISARHLVIIAGGVPDGSRDVAGARGRARDALGELLPEARAAGINLALEAIHPMRAAGGSIFSTLALANDVCVELGAGTGLIVDAYHVWWDPGLDVAIAASRGRILSFQFSDWLRDSEEIDGSDRGMPGDGVIDLPGMRAKVRAAGYDGYDELELFSRRNWWQRDPDELIETAFVRYREFVLGEAG